ncbi:hypothetical protein EDC04DRAFT_2913939 [Pisolithus marmoratus]|nr:hypothetical protein EDC04DRAFT_2913939 [Pisolithus marmoratus]
MSDTVLPTQENLPSVHFLSLPRGPGASLDNGPHLDRIVDTTTLAAHDFDVDTRTGFMPPRLSVDYPNNGSHGKPYWKKRCRLEVRELPTLPIEDLTSEILLRRAHHMLAFIMHFYIHTLPQTAPIVVPASISIPLLKVSRRLQLPPIATYSDAVLYNWELKEAPSTSEMETEPEWALDLRKLKSQDLFTGTRDEEEFFLSSARIELRGVEALELMRASMDELFVGDDIAVRRITPYLTRLAGVVQALTSLLNGCANGMRPGRVLSSREALVSRARFGSWREEVDVRGYCRVWGWIWTSPQTWLDNCASETSTTISGKADVRTLLRRMQIYMPRHHCAFLRHLSANPFPMRDFVQTKSLELIEAYNQAVCAVKGFRDAHIRIVALYILGPASRERAEDMGEFLKGTGGTHLAQFLKGVRDKTTDALLG